MALIESPKLFTLNRFAENPQEAFVSLPDRRFVNRVADYIEQTSEDGQIHDTVDHWEELGRQLNLPNTREVKLAMAGARKLMTEVIANLDMDIERHIDLDHNASNVLDGFCLTEEAKQRVMTGVFVAFDRSAIELEGDKPTQYLARGYRQVDLTNISEACAVTYLIALRMIDGQRIDGADRVDEDLDESQLPLIDPELPY